MYDLANLSWTYYNTFFMANVASIGFNSTDHFYCSEYNNVGSKYDTAMANQPTGSIGYSGTTLKIKDTDYTNATLFTEAVRGVQLVYELATPTTIQLTPEEVRSFLGTNNLWANTGDSEVTYYAQPNVPEEVLYKGQISTTSSYATANFTESVADDEEILVKVYCPARSAVDYKVIKVSDIGNGLNVGFNLHTTVNCTITKTSIASYQYSGDYYDIYADVLAYDSAIFN
jgi:hypothetical protein